MQEDVIGKPGVELAWSDNIRESGEKPGSQDDRSRRTEIAEAVQKAKREAEKRKQEQEAYAQAAQQAAETARLQQEKARMEYVEQQTRLAAELKERQAREMEIIREQCVSEALRAAELQRYDVRNVFMNHTCCGCRRFGVNGLKIGTVVILTSFACFGSCLTGLSAYRHTGKKKRNEAAKRLKGWSKRGLRQLQSEKQQKNGRIPVVRCGVVISRCMSRPGWLHSLRYGMLTRSSSVFEYVMNPVMWLDVTR